jgi:hypothetical protein
MARDRSRAGSSHPSLPLLANALQRPVVNPDLLAPERFRPQQILERLHRQPSLHPEDHDPMEPRAGSVEPGLGRSCCATPAVTRWPTRATTPGRSRAGSGIGRSPARHSIWWHSAFHRRGFAAFDLQLLLIVIRGGGASRLSNLVATPFKRPSPVEDVIDQTFT